VNIQLDAELEDTQGIRNLTSELLSRGISSTVYVTAEYANRNAPLIGELFRAGFEIALHGYYTGEQLETMTYAEQKDLLTRAQKAVEGCKPCGTYRPVVGFRPQYFSQNGDTYRVLDELGLTHNSGFKVGQIYLPGHENDAWPYRAETNRFTVIPITTVPAGNALVYLCDIACAQSLNWTPAQWEQALMTALASAIETRRPIVMLLHGWYTGDTAKYHYWQPFIKFLDTARNRVVFVNATELASLPPQ
jgi:peptidoglycan/xylan/chitin deacetylase (PgdA/CDA1 family)